ncbi:MAG: VOC family protein [Nitrospinota bacterium]|jgi:catechol 2,3-dioxygenase-like lactoylglutathione lyase family enzyme|nr:VOC family protein [Nitrospinota bacterium]
MGVIGGYHHVHIVSPDPEAVARWLGEFLGGEVTGREEPRGARNVIVRIGEAALSIRTPRPSDKIIETEGARPFGLDHICFLVDDLKAMVERMRAGGVEIAEEIFAHSGGSDAAFVVGPENVLFELIQKK